MSKRRTAERKEPKKRAVSKRDWSLFQQYGIQPKNLERDEFHEQYQSYDWSKDPGLPRNLSAVGPDGKLKPQTREALDLIAQFGGAFSADGGPMPMAHWSRVTGYKEPSAEERQAAMNYTNDNQIILSDGDRGNEELLEEIYGHAEASNKMHIAPVIISQTPRKVDWGLFPGEHLLEFPPFHFCPGLLRNESWAELDDGLATVQARVETLAQWQQLFGKLSLKLYIPESDLHGPLKLIYYYSSGNRMFVACVMRVKDQQRREFCKYFFILPQSL